GRHRAADRRDPDECERLADEAWQALGAIDVLVCNAGADTLTGEAAKWPFEKKLDELLAVDLKATMRLSRDVGARMKARGRGAILTVGWDQAEPGFQVGPASRAGPGYALPGRFRATGTARRSRSARGTYPDRVGLEDSAHPTRHFRRQSRSMFRGLSPFFTSSDSPELFTSPYLS